MDDQTLDLATLEGLTDPEQVRAVTGFLEPLEKDTELLLFVSPGCAVCPHQVRSAATVALASPHVVLEIVDASQEPELASRYEVRAVPTTVVDDELIMSGVVAPVELALRLVERQGPEEAKRVFRWLVGNGHHTAAAERVADGRATDGFVELWTDGDAEQRAVLLALADEAVLLNPFGLDDLARGLSTSGAEGGPSSQDDQWREDTAELLDRIGPPDE